MRGQQRREIRRSESSGEVRGQRGKRQGEARGEEK